MAPEGYDDYQAARGGQRAAVEAEDNGGEREVELAVAAVVRPGMAR